MYKQEKKLSGGGKILIMEGSGAKGEGSGGRGGGKWGQRGREVGIRYPPVHPLGNGVDPDLTAILRSQIRINAV